MIALAILVGVSLMAWVATVAAMAFCLWRFVWIPWQVMRKDLKALAEKFAEYDNRLDALDEFTRSARVQGLTDEEAASRERRYRFKRQQAAIIP